MADYLIRPAEARDLNAVAGIYNRIHDAEEQGRQTIGWLRDVYPVRQTAQAALDREELYVLETEGAVLGAAILNRTQVITYAQGHWAHDAPDEQVFVLHTLVIAPEARVGATAGPLWPFTRTWPGKTAAPSFAWTPTSATWPPAPSTTSWATPKWISCPLYSTVSPA